MTKTSHFNKFDCEFRLEFDLIVEHDHTMQKIDYAAIAEKMIDDCILSEYEINMSDKQFEIECKKSEYRNFILACKEIKAGRNISDWMQVVNLFIENNPIKFDYVDESKKAIEILYALKTKKMIKSLNMSDELDIKVYMKLFQIRNDIFKKYNISIT